MNTKQYRLYTPDSFLQATPLAGSGSDENLAPDQKVYHPIGQTPPTNPKRLILILTQTYEKRISTLFPVISIPQDMHNFQPAGSGSVSHHSSIHFNQSYETHPDPNANLRDSDQRKTSI
jgi:hypothetical protein